MLTRPSPDEFAPFYAGYVARVPEGDILSILAAQASLVERLSSRVSAAGESLRYSPGKWSVREVVGHLGDAERAFSFRLWCVSRGELAPLPGFDESVYVARSHFDVTPLETLVREFSCLRAASLALAERLGLEDWRQVGTANGSRISARALAYIMAGHVLHHLEILSTRYGLESANG